MTVKSVKHPDFEYWQVRDLDTGEILDRVQYADDETGFYIVCERGGRGVTFNRVKRGNIRLEDVREQQGPLPEPERDELQEALESAKEIVARLEEKIAERELAKRLPKPGRLLPTHTKDGRTITVDAIYVVGEGHVYI